MGNTEMIEFLTVYSRDVNKKTLAWSQIWPAASLHVVCSKSADLAHLVLGLSPRLTSVLGL